MNETPENLEPDNEESPDEEYEVVTFPLSWGGSSILVFFFHFYYASSLDWSARSGRQIYSELAAIAVVGLVLALVGRRRDRKGFPALAGSLLNGGVLLIIVATTITFLVAYYGRF